MSLATAGHLAAVEMLKCSIDPDCDTIRSSRLLSSPLMPEPDKAQNKISMVIQVEEIWTMCLLICYSVLMLKDILHVTSDPLMTPCLQLDKNQHAMFASANAPTPNATDECKEGIYRILDTILTDIPKEGAHFNGVEEIWKELKTAIISCCEETIGYDAREHQGQFDEIKHIIQNRIKKKRKALCA
eukprot:g41371.t1